MVLFAGQEVYQRHCNTNKDYFENESWNNENLEST